MGSIRERKTKDGGNYFEAEVKRKGFQSAYKTFARKTDAKAWIQDIETSMRLGRYAPQVEAQRHTLAQAIDRFVTEELPKKPRYLVDQKREILWFKEQIGQHSLAEITPALLCELKGKFLRGTTRYNRTRKPQTWNRYISSLSCVLEMCMREWMWTESNPARRIRREKEAPGRVRFLSETERAELLEACQKSRSQNLYPLVVLTLSTGMRRGEVWRLKWDQVDLAKGVIILSDTKNKDYRRVPVKGLALELLKGHAKIRRIDSNLVFPGDNTHKTGKPFHLDGFWGKAVKAAKLENFRFHDLRHSTASYLAMGGATMLEIAEVLGHRTLQMVKRYSHLADSHTAGVVERMNQRIFGVG